jgi:hypothetical protein
LSERKSEIEIVRILDVNFRSHLSIGRSSLLFCDTIEEITSHCVANGSSFVGHLQ